MATSMAEAEERWDRRFRYLPVVLLLLAAVLALAAGPTTGWTSPGWRLGAQLVVLAATAGVMGWWTFVRPEGRPSSLGRTYYAVRTALALVLTLLNPLFCLFAWVGFLDVVDHFRGRGRAAGVAATAVTMALGQSGGLRPGDGYGWYLLFAVLLVVNFGLALAMSHYAVHMQATNQERADAIDELERVNTELEHALADNAALQDQLLEQARTSGVQQERQRLAGEIHDTTAQALAGILAQLRAAQEEPDPAGRVRRAAELARAALTEARRSVMDLAPAPLSDAELPAVLERVVAAWAVDHPPAAELVVTGEPRPLHPEVEATVLRVAQEALANVAKHARADRVGVTVSYGDQEVILDVRDDGTGFVVGAPVGTRSFGLRGMRQRAERLAGVVDVEAEPGSGTAVSLRLPALQRGAA